MEKDIILDVKSIKKYFPIMGGGLLGNKKRGEVKAVDDISFTVKKGESYGIVGESGCGKSTTGKMIMQLLEPTAGEVWFEGKNLTDLSNSEMRAIRKDIQIIFQDPFASLNPRMKVKDIIEEPLINFKLTKSKKELKEKVLEIASQVGISEEQIHRYPHEFSGGQSQRIGIARALASNPKLIIADEPVSALDVSIQSQILNLMKKLQKEYGFTYIFISHDLSVVKHFCDRIGVMYLGRLVEVSKKHDLFNNPLHPYSEALMSAIPQPNPNIKKERIVLKGDVPSPSNPPTGCAFHPRCEYAMSVCKVERPELKEQKNERLVACHLHDDEIMKKMGEKQ